MFPKLFQFGFILVSFLVPFGIHFRYFFGIDFWMAFLMPFFDFWAKMVAKWLPKKLNFRTFSGIWPPRALQKRIRDATSIFHRFCIDSGTHFGDILMVSAPFFHNFRRQPRQFLPASRIQTFCFQLAGVLGCGGDALRLQ